MGWILLSDLSSSSILESKSISIPFLELEGFGMPQSLKPLEMGGILCTSTFMDLKLNKWNLQNYKICSTFKE
jgi:hypothetical protein